MILGVEGNEENSESLMKSRQIVSTVLDFGVTQQEMIYIIKGLAMELENRETMLKIIDVAEI